METHQYAVHFWLYRFAAMRPTHGDTIMLLYCHYNKNGTTSNRAQQIRALLSSWRRPLGQSGWSCYKHTRCWMSFSTAVFKSSRPSFSWAASRNSETCGLSGFVLAVWFKLPTSLHGKHLPFPQHPSCIWLLHSDTVRFYRTCVKQIQNRVNYCLKNARKVLKTQACTRPLACIQNNKVVYFFNVFSTVVYYKNKGQVFNFIHDWHVFTYRWEFFIYRPLTSLNILPEPERGQWNSIYVQNTRNHPPDK